MMIHRLNVTDSTNLDAWRNKDTAGDMTVWSAGFQTEGRGQRGNRWKSAERENLMFSILFKPHGIRAAGQYMIFQICSVGIVRYLKMKGLSARIKWPNDIYVGDRKICGMLIENVLSGDRLTVSIAGIGININQRVFPEDLPNPISLVLATEASGTGHAGPFDLDKELDEVLESIFALYSGSDGAGFADRLEDEYTGLLYRLGEYAMFEETEYVTGAAPHRFKGRIVGVERHTARLLVEKEDGQASGYYFKEIRYIL